MNIRGLQKTTLLDYPGKVACTVFTAGCNFRCPFCYNRDLVLDPSRLPEIAEAEFFAFIERRRGIFDGVVVCGGEPLLQPDLARFLCEIKHRGLLVKLDTNGSRPEILAGLLAGGLLDYVAMDIKGPLEVDFYRRVLGEGGTAAEMVLKGVKASLRLLLGSEIGFELRTTVVPGLHDQASLVNLAEQLGALTAGEPIVYYLQTFDPKTCLDPELNGIKPFPSQEMESFLTTIREFLPRATLRLR